MGELDDSEESVIETAYTVLGIGRVAALALRVRVALHTLPFTERVTCLTAKAIGGVSIHAGVAGVKALQYLCPCL